MLRDLVLFLAVFSSLSLFFYLKIFVGFLHDHDHLEVSFSRWQTSLRLDLPIFGMEYPHTLGGFGLRKDTLY
jgi:hypothetical protein